LSSGVRINRGADDPAGLIVSERLRAEIEGMTQAIDNAQQQNVLSLLGG
jgi:flagellin